MPIFEYQCSQCGAEFEKLVFSSDRRVECPKCRSVQVAKKLSAPNLTGTGKCGPTGAPGRSFS